MLQIIMIAFFGSLNLSYASDVDQKELTLHRESANLVFFEIKNINNKKETHSLKCNSMQECHLILEHDKNENKQVKISGNMAEQLDQEFIGHFVGFKYGKNGEADKKKCGPTYQLSMRSESHTLCKDEQAEIKSLEIFIAKLNKELGPGQ